MDVLVHGCIKRGLCELTQCPYIYLFRMELLKVSPFIHSLFTYSFNKYPAQILFCLPKLHTLKQVMKFFQNFSCAHNQGLPVGTHNVGTRLVLTVGSCY